MYQEQSYYRTYNADTDNTQITDHELIVNCCGVTSSAKPFCTARPHGRKDFYLQYIVKGELKMKAGDFCGIMIPGQLIIHPPNVFFTYENEKETEMQYYWVHFTGSRAGGLLERASLPLQDPIAIEKISSFLLIFEKLFEVFSVRSNYFDFTAAALLINLVSQINENRVWVEPFSNQRSLQTSISYIHQNFYKESIPLKYLAEIEHLSPSWYRAVFKEATGLSPKEYILIQKINHAKLLLQQTYLPIKEIAIEVGYQDQLSFSRIFSRKTGISPSEYRKRQE